MAFFRRSLPAALLALGLVDQLPGCVSRLVLNDRPCPCATGYVCCATSQTCLRPTQFCAPSDETGGAPSLPSQTAGEAGTPESPGAGGNAGDPAAEAGAPPGAGAPTEPHWRAVGKADDTLPAATDAPILALSPSGEAYMAYRACEPCEPYEERVEPPIVVKLGATWERIPGVGLSTVVKSSPGLLALDDGVLYLLTDLDRTLHQYSAGEWTSLGPLLPHPVHVPPQLAMDSGGKPYAGIIDDVTRELRVARLDAPGGWALLGSGVLANQDSLRLRVVGQQAYRAYTITQIDGITVHAYVESFDGAVWQPLGEFEAHDIELAVAPDGDVYVALEAKELNMARVERLHAGTWQELRTFSVSWRAPALQVTASGALYTAYLVEDYLNVNLHVDNTWTDLQSMTLGYGSTVPVLQVSEAGGTDVPFIGFLLGQTLSVRKYQ